MIPEGNPLEKSTQRIGRTLYLAGGEVRIISVLARAYGMCADGSCNQTWASVTGEWDDGTPALGCATAAMMVDSVDAKVPLFEVTDEVKVDDNTDALWSEVEFDKNSHLTTLGIGNLVDGDGTQTTGANLGVPEFPPTATDYLRTESAPNSAKFKFSAFPAAEGFAKMQMAVTIKNLAKGTSPIVIPLLKQPNGASFKLVIDAAEGSAKLIDKKKKNKKLFDGLFSDLLANPPEGVFLETTTCRTLSWTSPATDGYVCLVPGSFAHLLDDVATPPQLSVDVVDPRDFSPLPWSATSDDLAIGVTNATGIAGEPLLLDPSLANTADSPDTSVSWISVDSGVAINDPYLMPIATRKATGVPTPDVLVVTSVGGKVRLTGDASKDKLIIEGTIPLPDGFKPKKQVIVMQVLGHDYVFVLDKKGKSVGGKKDPSFTLKVPKTLPADGAFKIKLKKQDFSGGFAELGVHKDSAQGVPLLADLPIVGHFFGTETRATTTELMILISPELVAEVVPDE